MTDLTVKMTADDAATLYAAMLVCTMSGGGSPENNVLMRFADQIHSNTGGGDVTSTATARLERVSKICINEWLDHFCFADGVDFAQKVLEHHMKKP